LAGNYLFAIYLCAGYLFAGYLVGIWLFVICLVIICLLVLLFAYDYSVQNRSLICELFMASGTYKPDRLFGDCRLHDPHPLKHFPPPWSVEEQQAYFVVRDQQIGDVSGVAPAIVSLAFDVRFTPESGRRRARL
jgi:hypothetical protein